MDDVEADPEFFAIEIEVPIETFHEWLFVYDV
jgi:hypothetical protein